MDNISLQTDTEESLHSGDSDDNQITIGTIDENVCTISNDNQEKEDYNVIFF